MDQAPRKNQLPSFIRQLPSVFMSSHVIQVAPRLGQNLQDGLEFNGRGLPLAVAVTLLYVPNRVLQERGLKNSFDSKFYITVLSA